MDDRDPSACSFISERYADRLAGVRGFKIARRSARLCSAFFLVCKFGLSAARPNLPNSVALTARDRSCAPWQSETIFRTHDAILKRTASINAANQLGSAADG